MALLHGIGLNKGNFISACYFLWMRNLVFLHKEGQS